MSKVYTCFCTDIIHDGHLNIINQARKFGDVTVGALSDEALIRYNKFPTISLEERVKLYSEIDGVSSVVVQNSMIYEDVIPELKPDYVVLNRMLGYPEYMISNADDINLGGDMSSDSQMFIQENTDGTETKPYTPSQPVKKPETIEDLF